MTMLPISDGPDLRAHSLALIKEHRRGLIWVVALQVLAATAGLAGPQVLGRLVDSVKDGTLTFERVNLLVAIVVIAVVAQAVLVRYAQRASLILGEEVFAQLRERFIQTVTSLPLSTVERAGTGDLVSRTTNDVDRVQYTVRFGVPRLLVAIATIALTVTAAAITSWQTSLVMLLGVPVLVITARWYLKRATPAYLRESASYARINGTVTESVEGARTVDALNLGRRRRACRRLSSGGRLNGRLCRGGRRRSRRRWRGG